MPPNPFILVTPGATRGLGLALTREFLRTTNMPVYTSHRTSQSDSEIKKHIMGPLNDVDPDRLSLLKLDLTSESSIAAAANSLAESLKQRRMENAYVSTAFITGGMLLPEKKPADMDWDAIKQTFQINVISHMLIIKHFSRFLPSTVQAPELQHPAKWAHVSARVGSIEDNKKGGWYSYRASKAALNQVVKSFDQYLEQHNTQAMAVAVHPGTVKTDLSKGFWDSSPGEIFQPDDAAANLVNVVSNLSTKQRGKFWDWAGEQVPW
ncbi:hypothetical protein D9613_005549 [Agrocybe pediades]|uniref:Uncharacterized protein n=1 Tax=Agrocybe pediades TaxID=84607 RepID=A0A8H4VR15_9AGAR|nr:hypothetical protein D9613_005549 [Agrocybe pediades]